MRGVRLTGVLLVLAISACAPAKLEPGREKKVSEVAHEAALVRGLSGGEDADARMALARWASDAHREGWSKEPVFVKANGRLFYVRYAPAGAGVFSPTSFDRLEPAAVHSTEGIPMTGYRKKRESPWQWYQPKEVSQKLTLHVIAGKRMADYQNVDFRLVGRN